MTILITGGAGYIGSQTAFDFIDQGRDIAVLDNLSRGSKDALPSGVPLIEDDLADVPRLTDLLQQGGYSAVVHFAAFTNVAEAIEKPLAYYDTNFARTRNLVEAATSAGIKHFIFSSTAAVYADKGGPQKREDAHVNPASPYGRSKFMSEQMLLDTAAVSDLDICILRYFNVAGADPQGRTGPREKGATSLVRVACQSALGHRGPLQIFGDDFDTPDGTGVRDYVHVADIARAHLLALDHLESGGGSLIANVGYGHGTSVREVIDRLTALVGKFDVETLPRRTGDLGNVICDAARIRDVLGWQPRFDDLDAILTHSLNWERKLPKPERQA